MVQQEKKKKTDMDKKKKKRVLKGKISSKSTFRAYIQYNQVQLFFFYDDENTFISLESNKVQHSAVLLKKEL